MAALLLAVMASNACGGAALERFEFRERHMGTEARLAFYAPDRAAAEHAARAAFSRIAELDSILSDYRADSELNAVTRAHPDTGAAVGSDLFAVLAFALPLARETNGAFDITAGPVVRLWREALRTTHLPGDSARCSALARVGWQHVSLDSARRRVTFALPGMQLDAGGVGKGYAADAALDVLAQHGIRRALVEFGGEVVAREAPPQSDGWTVRVSVRDSQPVDVLLSNAAVSTSGDQEQFADIGGVRYSHVVDPRTGLGLVGGVTVSVQAPSGMQADAWATAASVLNERERAGFIASRPQARWWISPPFPQGTPPAGCPPSEEPERNLSEAAGVR